MSFDTFGIIHLSRGDSFPDVPRNAIVAVLDGHLEVTTVDGVFFADERDIIVLRSAAPIHARALGDFSCEIYSFADCVSPHGLFALEALEKNTILKAQDGKSDDVFEYLKRVKDEFSAHRAFRDDVLRGLSLCVISSLVRAMDIGEEELAHARRTRSSATAPEHSDEMAEVISFIDSSLSTDIGVEKLAALAHMSRSQLYKVFRRHTGMTINEYILHRRVENTVRLLSDTDCSVIEAAYDSGFTSSSGFYKTFRRIVGCSPKEYMKKAGGNSR